MSVSKILLSYFLSISFYICNSYVFTWLHMCKLGIEKIRHASPSTKLVAPGPDVTIVKLKFGPPLNMSQPSLLRLFMSNRNITYIFLFGKWSTKKEMKIPVIM